MKKKNNKGFLLMETVIVGVLVLAIFVLVYQNLVPTIGEYETRIRYDDVDSVYAANMFKNILTNDANFKNIIQEVENKGYKDVTDCTAFTGDLRTSCQVLKQQYGITGNNRIIVGLIPFTQVVTISNLPRGFLDYVKYLQTSAPDIVSGYVVMISRTITYKDTNGTGKTITTNQYANIQI